MEQKVIAYYVHQDIGALKIYSKTKQPNGKFKIRTPLGEFENVPPERILIPE